MEVGIEWSTQCAQWGINPLIIAMIKRPTRTMICKLISKIAGPTNSLEKHENWAPEDKKATISNKLSCSLFLQMARACDVLSSSVGSQEPPIKSIEQKIMHTHME